jgi:hypothetical protein
MLHTSVEGHSRPGRADGRSGYVGFPPILTGFRSAAEFRDVPQPDILMPLKFRLFELAGVEALPLALPPRGRSR